MNNLCASAIPSGRRVATLITMLLTGTAAFAETTLPVFPPDTEVRLAITRPISSATATLGEKVELTVVADVVVDEQVVIPKGSPGVGTVVFTRRKALGGFPGALDLRADHVLVGEAKVDLRSRSSVRGRSSSTVAANLAPVGIGLFLTGSEIALPAGSELLAYVATVPVGQAAPAGAPAWMPPARDGKGLVFFFRANDKSNPFLAHQKIRIDDQVVGTMENDHYFYVYVDPGEHRIESSMTIIRLLRVAAGETVYLQGKLVQGIWLSDTDPDLAQDLIAGLKLTAAP